MSTPSATALAPPDPVTVKARWGDEIVVPEDDPFQARVEEVGFPIELGEDDARLQTRVAEQLEAESALYNAGIRCEAKDSPDVTCLACPISAHADSSSSMQVLCQLGRAQERTLTEIAIGRQARCAEPGS